MYIGLGKPRYVALWKSNTGMYATEYSPLEFVDIAATALAVPNRQHQVPNSGPSVAPVHPKAAMTGVA